jgi:hypothetical protein
MVRGTPVYEREAEVMPGSELETFGDPVGENVRGHGAEADDGET